MSDVKRLVASIVSFLRSQLANGIGNAEAAESLEIGVQCLESAYSINSDDVQAAVDLLEMFRKNDPSSAAEVTDEIKAQAEALKNEGNDFMRAEKYAEALQKYSQAIDLHSKNSVFYCNRAASHYYLNNMDASIRDCNTAISLNPQYGRAYGRLGLALTKQNKHAEAKNAYQKALQLEPDNEAYKHNLQLSETALQQAPPEAVDIGSLLQNPTLMNVATQLLSDPDMQNLMSNLVENVGVTQNANSSRGINALLQAGQQLAQHMQRANPELVERLRTQMVNLNPDNPSGDQGSSTPPQPPQ